MDLSYLWSIRLGFTGKQAKAIQKDGMSSFLDKSFDFNLKPSLPDCLKNQPKTYQEYKDFVKKLTKPDGSDSPVQENLTITIYNLRSWWVDKLYNNSFPLREKMVLFWHNHYVSTAQKVKLPYWIYEHNQVLRQGAFGNFRELTKNVLYTNAMIKYLDNNQNVKDNYNENLSRELLELFTLGIGNYTEADIKNGAMALAGLTFGDKKAKYYAKKESTTEINYLGQKGNLKANDIVDIIFRQESAPYFITEKILKFFIYDNPTKELVRYYGDYLKEVDYEIKPFLKKIFIEEYNKPTAGSKIKDPATFILQLTDELNIEKPNYKLISLFLQIHGMNLFEQPNVKGWEGGFTWITAQRFLNRQKTIDQLCKGRALNPWLLKNARAENESYNDNFKTNVEWKSGNNKDIIAQLSSRLLFTVDENLQKNLETLLKYDFDPDIPTASEAVKRLFNYIAKTPEFQII